MNIEDFVYTLKIEKEYKIHNGIYNLIQRELAYHSNKLANNDLSKDNVMHILENGFVYCHGGKVIKSSDVEEICGHSLMFDYMLYTLDDELSQPVIKGLHKHFRQCVFEDVAEDNSVGEYRDSGNIPDRLEELINWYRSQEVALDILAVFYVKYLDINPFKNGSSQVGRMILFRECIRHNITPFVIQNAKKYSYEQALCKARVNGEFSELVQLFTNAQADYESLCEGFLMNKPKSAASALFGGN